MSGLLYTVHWFMFYSITFILPGRLQFTTVYVHPAGYILLPVTGWIGESWLGRYRAIVFGLVMSGLTVLVVQIGFLYLQSTLHSGAISFLLTSVAVVIGILGFGSLYTIMLPFSLDQMIGASAEELSAAVQWNYWGFNIALAISGVLSCVSIPEQFQFFEIISVFLLILGSLSLSAALIMDWLCHKWLDTHNKTGNPIRLIFQVLNYARKNKCPRLRSALTYIDEEHPSRIDFGKHKFGGPFTEEEVEDVKTIYRLTPLLVHGCIWCKHFS